MNDISTAPLFLNIQDLARLSEFADVLDVVVRDVPFKTIGKAPTKAKQILAPASKVAHIQQALQNPGVVGFITTPELVDEVPTTHGVAVSENPSGAAHQIHCELAERPGYFRNGLCNIASDVIVEPGACIATHDVEIAEGCRVCSGAVILPGVRLGRNVKVGPCINQAL